MGTKPALAKFPASDLIISASLGVRVHDFGTHHRGGHTGWVLLPATTAQSRPQEAFAVDFLSVVQGRERQHPKPGNATRARNIGTGIYEPRRVGRKPCPQIQVEYPGNAVGSPGFPGGSRPQPSPGFPSILCGCFVQQPGGLTWK